jgi:peptidoglycan/LPS O-acetylase OafA/YrhL
VTTTPFIADQPPEARTMRLEYRPALDGIRAFAVIAVMLYHLDVRGVAGGFLGVDAFFVLSGFLITTLLLDEHRRTNTIDLATFWFRRLRRLLPALLLTVAAIVLFTAVAASPTRFTDLRWEGLTTLLYVVNWRFIADKVSYFDLFTDASPYRHIWSLAIEGQFYLVWPLVVLGALRRSRRALAVIAGVLTVVSVAIMSLTYEPGDPSRAYFGTDARVHELLIGCLLAMLLSVYGDRIAAKGRAVVGAGLASSLAIVVAFSVVQDTGSAYYHGGSLVFAVLVAVVIASVMSSETSALGRALALPPVRWVGEISYGLYLWHWPVIVWFTSRRTHLDGIRLTVLRVALTFAAATASFYIVERPIRTGKVPRRAVAAGLAVAVVVVAIACVGVTRKARTDPLAAEATFTLPPPRPSGAPRPFAVIVGDSVARSIARGFQQLPDADRFVSLAVPGCGIAAGVAVIPGGRVWEPSRTCRRETERMQTEYVARDDPDVVIWYSEWEVSDRLVDEKVAEFGSDEHTKDLRRDLEAAYERLTAGGAHIVLLTGPPRTAANAQAAAIHWDERSAAYNRLLGELAEHHKATTTLVDLVPIVCPGGPPCAEQVDGITLRPDGAHYSTEGAAWLAQKLLGSIPGF